MAQALFEALAGVSGMESQTALAVQSLLESQTLTEAGPVQDEEEEEEDVFQCGKCKKQFRSLPKFVSHKQSRCTPPQPPQPQQLASIVSLRSSTEVVPSQSSHQQQSVHYVTSEPLKQLGSNASLVQSLPSFHTLPHSPTLAFGQGMVLSDDLSGGMASFSSAVEAGAVTQGSSSVQGTFLAGGQPLKAVSMAASFSPMLASSSVLPSYTSAPHASFPVSIVTSPPSPQQQQMSVGQGDPTSQPPLIITSTLPPVEGGEGLGRAISLGTLEPKEGEHRLQVVAEVPSSSSSQLDSANNQQGISSLVAVLPERVSLQPAIGQQPLGNMGAKARRKIDITLKNALEEPPPPAAEKKRLRCHYCDKVFLKNFDLQQHIRSHTGEKPFQCIVCGRAFAQKSNVKKHMATHKVWPEGLAKTLPEQPPAAKEEPSSVQIPGSQTPSLEEVSISTGSNNKVTVTVDNTFICQYCGTKFKTYFQLKSHMVQHKSEQVYKCILRSCNQTFKELDAFLEHTKTHESEMTYRCHMCSKLFPSLYELGVHQYSHSLYPNQGPKTATRHFRCNKCGGKYASPEALHHHLQTVSHRYECPHCRKIFACERYLRRHLLIHGVGEHACDICFKRFKTEQYLKVHMVTHSDERPFACEVCDAAFNRRDKLRRHMLGHESTKRFKCPFRAHTGCDKEFNRPDKLKAHIITHCGVRPFKCGQCSKHFSRRASLEEHRWLHKPHARFLCPQCGQQFQRVKSLRCHRCRVKLQTLEAPAPGSDEAKTASEAPAEGQKEKTASDEPQEMDEEPDDPSKTPYLRNRRKISQPKKRLLEAAGGVAPRRGRGRPRKRRPAATKVLTPVKPSGVEPVDAPQQWQIIIAEEGEGQAGGVEGSSSIVISEDKGSFCVLQPYIGQDGQATGQPLEVTLQPSTDFAAIELAEGSETLTYEQALAYAQLQAVDGGLTAVQGATLVAMGDQALVVDEVIQDGQVLAASDHKVGEGFEASTGEHETSPK